MPAPRSPAALSSPARPRLHLLLEPLVTRAAGSTADRTIPARYHPFVVVGSPDRTARWFADLIAARTDPAGNSAVEFWDGAALGQAIGTALAGDELFKLRARVVATSLLLVADVERIGSAERQRAFAWLLDEAAAAGSVFCVSLAVPPAASALDAMLASRLAGGLVIPLPEPVAVRQAAEPPGSSVRQPTLRRIIRLTARHHGLQPEEMIGPSRRRSVAAARSVGMYLARVLTTKSLQAIGDAFGGRDHTTVMHSLRLATERFGDNPWLAADLASLIAAIRT